MSKRSYVPERGDVVHVNLGGTGGSREMDGPHERSAIRAAALDVTQVGPDRQFIDDLIDRLFSIVD